MRYDLISLGETLLRLSPPDNMQLRRTSSLDVHVVGSQLNVAANLARLGLSTAFITRLPDSPLGELAIDSCKSYGVDTSLISLLPKGKMGITYVEFSVSPRAPKAIYDRAGSAASTIAAGDYDWDAIADSTKAMYCDGIFPGLSPMCSEATIEFYKAAKKHGRITCLDVNYREHLWSPSEAKVSWLRILPNIDVLVTNVGVSKQIFGWSGSDDELMRRYAGEFGCEVVCLTSREINGLRAGAWSSKALHNGSILNGQRREFEIIDRYGTGDAWFAGFLYGYLSANDVEYALNFGNALCALAHTVVGDIAHFTSDDVESVMSGEPDLRLKR